MAERPSHAARRRKKSAISSEPGADAVAKMRSAISHRPARRPCPDRLRARQAPAGGRAFLTRDPSHFVRIVFIDFDGVMHPASAAVDLKRSFIQQASPAELRARGLFVYTRILAEALKGAHDSAELRVVVHSSWRSNFRDDEIRRVIPELEPWLLGTVGFPTLARDAAIMKWLEMMGDKVSDFLVLDDVPQLFAGGAAKWANLVLCAPEKGLDEPRVQEELKKFLTGRRKREKEDLGALDFESVDLESLKASLKR
jgi:hypothetical protein